MSFRKQTKRDTEKPISHNGPTKYIIQKRLKQGQTVMWTQRKYFLKILKLSINRWQQSEGVHLIEYGDNKKLLQEVRS